MDFDGRVFTAPRCITIRCGCTGSIQLLGPCDPRSAPSTCPRDRTRSRSTTSAGRSGDAVRFGEVVPEPLETESLGLAEVSRECGYDSPETFRVAFKRVTGVAPGQYRRRFRLGRRAT
ncbi:MAG: helix-turn-helix domain-containing protein [Gemmatimonadales bacterium]